MERCVGHSNRKRRLASSRFPLQAIAHILGGKKAIPNLLYRELDSELWSFV